MKFRLIPALDENPRIVQFVQAPLGKFLLLALFAVGLKLHPYIPFFPTLLVLVALSVLPNLKNHILLISAFLFSLFLSNFSLELLHGIAAQSKATLLEAQPLIKAAFIASILLGSVLLVEAERKRLLFGGKYPVLRLILGLNIGILILSVVFKPEWPITYHLWCWTLIFIQYFWFIAYSLHENRIYGLSLETPHLGFYRPFWGATPIPVHKGIKYLQKIEAKDAQELAITQLKGLKLIFWTWILRIMADPFNFFLTGRTAYFPFLKHFPVFTVELPHAISLRIINERNFSWSIYWLILIAGCSLFQMNVTIYGNCLISICRMAGFRMYRFSYKPLQSKNFLDFFRRFHYYYSQLLLNIYFFPVFFRFFKKKNRKLRLFFAAFVTIWVGGGIQTHYFIYPQFIVWHGFFKGLYYWLPGSIYHFSFAVLIGLSLAFEDRRAPAISGSGFRQVVRFARLYLVYCFIFAWALSPLWQPGEPIDHVVFIGRLLGLSIHY